MSLPKLAIVVALILIGGASWLRITNTQKISGNLYIAKDQNKNTSQGIDAENFINVSDLSTNNSSDTSVPTLTDADTIGRNLLSDYLNLAYSGQDTDQNITDLANKYADALSTINKTADIKLSDINVIENSKTNLQTYADNISRTYLKYHSLMTAIDTKGRDFSKPGPDMTYVTSKLAALYKQEVDELKKFAVPQSLAKEHVNLINIYLSTVQALQTLSNADKDPIGAYRAIIIEKNNIQEESTIFSNLEKILVAGGIIHINP